VTPQFNAVERRQNPREGILGQLQDATYVVLRGYGVGEPNAGPANSSARLDPIIVSSRRPFPAQGPASV
jgi:hypothetical protein